MFKGKRKFGLATFRIAVKFAGWRAKNVPMH